MYCIQEVKNQLFIPIANLKSVKKGIKYSDIKIYTVCSAIFQTLGITRNNLKIRYAGIF
jgi:hypothetical protein